MKIIDTHQDEHGHEMLTDNLKNWQIAALYGFLIVIGLLLVLAWSLAVWSFAFSLTLKMFNIEPC